MCLFAVIDTDICQIRILCYTTNIWLEMVSLGMDKRYLDRLNQVVEDRLFITGKSVREVI